MPSTIDTNESTLRRNRGLPRRMRQGKNSRRNMDLVLKQETQAGFHSGQWESRLQAADGKGHRLKADPGKDRLKAGLQRTPRDPKCYLAPEELNHA